ncbi:sugar ABC transporter permease [Asanoa siamensis]|uniref:Xylose transport system permease protein XylH n=1 Tax=Asanoa siamensis TaxID=926357 RepID=A0ABQ4CNT1_9ACTN|nr:ABC transporter permease [Asanoa siamensis]GIF72941.1 ABC transporter permease [Asanoa siamensis]
MSTPTKVEATEPATQPTPPAGNPIVGAIGDWWAKVRGGDAGSLPATLGIIVLVIVFASLRPNTFTNAFNFANLIHQAAAVIVIAMGLVFVLLLGEIDLSAGYAAGTAAATMGIVVTRWGWSWPLGILTCLVTGAVVGLLIGLLVAKLGIPSFVVTLAAFLALQGVLLKFIGEGGTIPIRDETLRAINNNDMPVWLGWVMYALVVGGYAAIVLRRGAKRRAGGLSYEAVQVTLAKIVSLAVLLGLVTYWLSIERSRNAAVTSIKGVPIVVAVLLVLLVGLTFLLTKTSFGRHVYAVGGNAEAARRAGINVAMVKLACFMIGSTLAAVGGIMLASRDNSISPSTGGASTLLYAVGAAVIGGTSLFGGKGRIVDAILGGFVIAIIINGMGLLNQPSSVVYMVTGLVLLVAASVDAISRRRARSTGRV